MLEILLIDDEPLIRLTVGDALKEGGYSVTLAADGAEGAELLDRQVFDVVITDIRLPKMDGLSLFRLIKERSPATDVILITAYGAVNDAVSALKEGARDYLTKPFDTEEILFRVGRLAKERSLRSELDEARAALAEATGREREIVGRSPSMLRLFHRIEAFADSDASVLIVGESGTGKELVARALHDRSTRAKKPFVAVNCAAFPETLLDAELFGHERGAFTGATRKREGRFQAADGGTLFLDEVAEIPLPAQAKLLRVLQEKAVEPLGSNRSIKVDVRILAATHRNLRERIAQALFREDLFYRLNVLEIVVPPLRERHGDLPLLVQHFLERFSRDGKRPSISPRALRALSAYEFPGNVRELEHALHQALVLARGGPIGVEHLPEAVAQCAGPEVAGEEPSGDSEVLPLSVALKAYERDYLVRALRRVEGRRTQAADLLGISRKTLWEKVRAHGIADDEFG
jgi:two-component system response regulator AtoC